VQNARVLIKYNLILYQAKFTTALEAYIRKRKNDSFSAEVLRQIDVVCISYIFYLEIVQRKGFDGVRTGHIGYVIYQGSSAGRFHNNLIV
jgi:hypothetical protein